MKILAIFGSPRVNGKLSKLTQRALEGAASAGAEIKRFDLIKQNIKYCLNCGNCVFKNPELPIGNCVLKDDVHEMFREYLTCDGYIYASPVYDMFISALMKTFLERKMMLMYREKEAYARIPAPRVPQNFMKKASYIVSGNCADELIEVMGDPCFEAFEAHHILEQIDTVDKMYAGGLENITDEGFSQKLDLTYGLGKNLVQSIQNARN